MFLNQIPSAWWSRGTGAVAFHSGSSMEKCYPLQLHLNWAAGSLLWIRDNHGIQAFEVSMKRIELSSWVKFMGTQIPLWGIFQDILLSAEKNSC